MSIQSCNQEVLRAVDAREALFNGGEIGPIKHVQISTERITSLRGIFFDLDLELYRQSPLLPAVQTDPEEFFEAVVQQWLSRHSVLNKAEVRCSGTGLHAILWFDEPLQFETAGERERWGGIVKVIQAALPTDPDAPAITAITRPLESINGKNDGVVEQLKPGTKVTIEEVEGLFHELCDAPFKTVFHILTGSERIEPCPICCKEGTTLSALEFTGKCYGACGKVELAQLYDLILSPRENASKEQESNDKNPQ